MLTMGLLSIALIANSLQQEFGLNGVQISNVFVSLSAGFCAGAFTWGVLLDIIGPYNKM